MPKRLIALAALSLCLYAAFIISPGAKMGSYVKADATSIQINTDGSTNVNVVVSESSFNGKEMSFVCYRPSWNGIYSEWDSSKNDVAYIGQKKVNGVTAVNFKLNKAEDGEYTLVLSAGGQKIEKKFSLSPKQQQPPAQGGLQTVADVAAPSGVKAVQTAASKVKISWGSVSTAQKYTVYRSTKKDSGYKKTADVSSCSYTDKKCKAGKTYYYKVSATSGKESPLSSAAKVKLMAAPKIKVSVKGKTATVSWKKIKGVKGYKVYISNKKKGKYKQAADIKKAKKVKCTIKLAGKKTCYIKVRAYKKNGKKIVYGKYSAVKKAGR